MTRSDSDSCSERKHKRKKKKHSRSRSRERRYSKNPSKKSKGSTSKRSRTRSTSHSRSRQKSRDRSRSRSRHRRSRSRSHGRRSRSHSRGRRSKSRSSERRSLSHKRHSDSESRHKHSSHKSTPDIKITDDVKKSPDMSLLAEQAKMRMRAALNAAAAGSNRLRDQGDKSYEQTAEDQARFQHVMATINSDSFVSTSFSSNRSNAKPKADVGFGTSAELILGPAEPTKVLSTESYAHPNLDKDPEEAMKKWINKLTLLRQRFLKETMAT